MNIKTVKHKKNSKIKNVKEDKPEGLDCLHNMHGRLQLFTKKAMVFIGGDILFERKKWTK